MSRMSVTWSLLFAAAVLSGCSSPDPSRPSVTTSLNDGFVPLQVGNTWSANVTQTTTTTFLDGSPSPPPKILELAAERRIIGTEEISGEVYAVEQLTLSDGTETALSWTRYRQDEEGLYSAAVPTSQPPAVRSALLIEEMSVVAGERTRLRYPLETGASWAVSATERATVEGMETLQLPAGNIEAYRVSVESVLGGPDDYVLAWYSSCGLVRWFSHQVIRANGPPGGQGVLIVRDYVEALSEFIPSGKQACDLAPAVSGH